MIRQLSGQGFLKKDAKDICCTDVKDPCKYVFTGAVAEVDGIDTVQLASDVEYVVVNEFISDDESKTHTLKIGKYKTLHEFAHEFSKAIFKAGYAPTGTQKSVRFTEEGDLEILGELEILSFIDADGNETMPDEVLCKAISICEYSVAFISETDPVITIGEDSTTLTGTWDAIADDQTQGDALAALIEGIDGIEKATVTVTPGSAYTVLVEVTNEYPAPKWNGDKTELCGCHLDFIAEP